MSKIDKEITREIKELKRKVESLIDDSYDGSVNGFANDCGVNKDSIRRLLLMTYRDIESGHIKYRTVKKLYDAIGFDVAVKQRRKPKARSRK